ncbi:polyprenyl synthetase family protein [Actinomadura litoris]|uniref:Polyprenyl synthetase family protein n=1 Tax=Actinomadura litoris TaxID=2678616 RepID=A0A7K1L5G0_9ACTN|nr:polyprenyl synthetase family protein [Actinomadura litoris]MUN39629.1 polyprenyl synthetase family protein [Actinomadura litoris]
MTAGTRSTSAAAALEVKGRIDRALAEFLDDRLGELSRLDDASAFELLRPYVLSGGKRIRPMLCYWGWRGAGGADRDEAVRAAAALELFHSFALIHDDIMDGSDIRRGRPAMHRRLAALHEESGWNGDPDAFGVSAAMLFGDLLLVWADELLYTSGVDPARLRAARPVYDRMRAEAICGQYLDVAETAKGVPSVARSMRVVRYKAARYTVEHPLVLGGVMAGGGGRLLAAYSAFGRPLGEAFQLRDDLLGVFGDPGVTGKSNLDDLREGKPTVLMAYAVEHATLAQRALINRLHGAADLDESAARDLRKVLDETGAHAAVEDMIEVRGRHALTALRAAPLTEDAGQALTALTDAALWRHS